MLNLETLVDHIDQRYDADEVFIESELRMVLERDLEGPALTAAVDR